MKNLQQHFYLIFLFHFLFTGCGSYSSNEDKMDGGFHPVVFSTSPFDGETNVEVTTSISLQFSQGIKTNTVTTNDSNTNCSGTVQISTDNFSTCTKMSSVVGNSNNNKTISVTPESNLNGETNYYIRVTTEIIGDSGGRYWNLGLHIALVLPFVALLSRFLVADVSYHYVWLHGGENLPFRYRFAAVWAAREGPLLLWA